MTSLTTFGRETGRASHQAKILTDLSPAFPPELELLMLAARLDGPHQDRWEQLLRSDLDWSLLLEFAYYHQLLPLLYVKLNRDHRQSIPSAVYHNLKHIYRVNAQRNLFLMRLLLQVLDLFTANGIQSVPLKGPVFAQGYYGDALLRHFGDLDILICPDDLEKASGLLLDSGFSTEVNLDRAGLSWLLRSYWEVSFRFRDDRLDLHYHLFDSHFQYPLKDEAFWSNLNTCDFYGRPIYQFHPEYLFLFLCIHGAKHHWAKVSWISDLARTIHLHPDLDWGQVFTIADQNGFLDIVVLGIHLARLVCGVEIPVKYLQYEVAYPQLQSLLQRSLSDLNTLTSPSEIEYLRYYFYLRERWQDRAYMVYDLLFVPKYIDFEALPLPDFLYPLYYFFRPFRMFFKTASRSLPPRFWLFH